MRADAKTIPLADGSVQCVVTSPPYWGLRDYGVPGQLGLERTPEEYVANMVAVFREVKRVLRKDGTCWINLGDSYASGDRSTYRSGASDNKGQLVQNDMPRPQTPPGLKPKDLVGIPWRVAFALQADGWWLRQDIIWAKPNPMPESVTDRCTKSHEYIFLLTKSARYFWDAEAVKEPSIHAGEVVVNDNGKNSEMGQYGATRTGFLGEVTVAANRNLRSVWNIATQPYRGSHFAVFPAKLVEPCVLAGTSERGCCAECAAPWERVTESERTFESGSGQSGNLPSGKNGRNLQGGGETLDIRRGPVVHSTTVGWKPTCSCGSGDLLPGDLEMIASPTGERSGADQSLETGRGGYNRPRGENEGQRPITRYEQRKYAEQLRASAHRAEMATEAGTAFAHYLRVDRSGARPIPKLLLDSWLERGWLNRISIPAGQVPETKPCIVLDPFCGSGTVGVVCARTGRDFIGLDISEQYLALARRRIGEVPFALPFHAEATA